MSQDCRRFSWSGAVDAEMQQSFTKDGFLVIEDFVSPQECDDLLSRSHTLIEQFDVAQNKVVFSASGQSHAAHDYFMQSAGKISFFLEQGAVDENGDLRKEKARAINKIGHALHDLDPVFSAFSRSKKMEILARNCGLEDPRLLQSMVICKQPRIGAEVNAHQDSTFLYTEPQSCIGLWVALEDATRENGCMWAAAGGHKSNLRQRFVHQDNASDNGMVMQVLDDTPFDECTTALEAPKGTVVVLHGRLPHLSHANLSEKSRYAYALHLIDGQAAYASDNWLQRPADMPLQGF